MSMLIIAVARPSCFSAAGLLDSVLGAVKKESNSCGAIRLGPLIGNASFQLLSGGNGKLSIKEFMQVANPGCENPAESSNGHAHPCKNDLCAKAGFEFHQGGKEGILTPEFPKTWTTNTFSRRDIAMHLRLHTRNGAFSIPIAYAVRHAIPVHPGI